MLAFLRDRRVRGYLFQLITIIGVVAFLWYIGVNTTHNIEQRGIKTGFGFLNSTAGFGINDSPISYTPSNSYGRVFLVGLLNTLIVSFVAIIFSTILGLFVGVLRLSKNWLMRKLSAAYIEIFRNIPILLQILFWYNVVLRSLPSPRGSIDIFGTIFINNRGLYIPQPALDATVISVLLSFILVIVFVFFLNRWSNKRQEQTGQEFPVLPVGLGLLIVVPIIGYFVGGANFDFSYPHLQGFNFQGGKQFYPEFIALAMAITIYTATFIAEAVRSGIEAVNKGQKEAAASIGLSSYQALKLVVLPQAVRIAIPPTINQYLNIVKNSSLATAIGYPELVTVFAGTTLNQVGQAIEIISITMLVYLVVSLVVSALLNWINHKMKIKER
ncbi:amino acid ABC transporter permease [Sulfurospirillum sp. 1612]|uniref:amino acid ABC transporter permease n=1 Tax=Sulfurospirillum sp. 1612 TaxID=3094835 RepID=UPI002F9588DC